MSSQNCEHTLSKFQRLKNNQNYENKSLRFGRE